jgi:tetratricopeptide (TPR) repeat protein
MRAMRVALLAAPALILLFAGSAGAESIVCERRVVLGVPLHAITVDLNDPHVKVSSQLAAGFPGGDEPFTSMVKRSGAIAAVTGTYFSTISRLPVGDVVIDGALRYFGGFGTAVALTPGNQVTFKRVPFGRHVDWREQETVVSSGPRLVHEGQVAVDARAEGFSDPRVLSRAWRVAVGLTPGRKLLLVAVTRKLTLTELARIMERLGCREAINMDGGSSTAMYYRGRMVTAPSRRLVNLLTVHENVPRSARYAGAPPRERIARHEKIRKERAFAYYQQAQDLRRQGQFGFAAGSLKFACFLDPTNASYHAALGEAQLQVGDTRGAAGAFTNAGRAYVAKRQSAKAVAQLRRALDLSPLHVPARETLAQAYERDGFTKLATQERRLAAMARLKLATPSTNWPQMHELARQLTEPSLTLLSAVRTQKPAQRRPYRFTGELSGNVYRDASLGLVLQAPPGWQLVRPKGKEALELHSLTQPGYCTIQVLPTAGSVRLPEFVTACHSGSFSVEVSERPATAAGLPAYDATRQQVVSGKTIASSSVAAQQGDRVFILSLTQQSTLSARARAAFRSLLTRLRIHAPRRGDDAPRREDGREGN